MAVTTNTIQGYLVHVTYGIYRYFHVYIFLLLKDDSSRTCQFEWSLSLNRQINAASLTLLLEINDSGKPKLRKSSKK